jgi:hypothetical protein
MCVDLVCLCVWMFGFMNHLYVGLGCVLCYIRCVMDLDELSLCVYLHFFCFGWKAPASTMFWNAKWGRLVLMLLALRPHNSALMNSAPRLHNSTLMLLALRPPQLGANALCVEAPQLGANAIRAKAPQNSFLSYQHWCLRLVWPSRVTVHIHKYKYGNTNKKVHNNRSPNELQTKSTLVLP